jgi:hypothetical protein
MHGRVEKCAHRKPEGKRLCGRPECRWEDNIRIDLSEIGWEGVDWIHLAKDRNWCQALVNVVRNLQVLQKAWIFLTS